MKLSTNANYSKKEKQRKLLTRILCFALALLMVLGSVYYVFAFLIYEASALEGGTEVNPLITVGITFDEDAEAGWQATSTNGFLLGKAIIADSGRGFEEVWEIRNTSVTVAIDYNLSRYGGTYYKEFNSNFAVGMYHIEAGGRIATRSQAEAAVNKVKNLVGGAYSVFPGYINGTYRVYVGDFSTKERAENALQSLSALRSAYDTRIIGTGDSTVSVIDHTSNTVLFEYDCGAASYLGLEPIQIGYETAYTKSSLNYLYPGVMVFRRVIEGSRDVIEAINLVDLETYVTGVIPWEIGNYWAIEAQRVFAIAARTYYVKNSRSHFRSDGFDLCPNQHCQAYLGCSRTNESVIGAVMATSGMVVSYQGKLADVFYCSLLGGESVAVKDVWGSGRDYLTYVKTPWEQYADYPGGVWQFEVSPKDLADYLANKGYTQFAGQKIASINVNSHAGDTGYVYSLTIVDTAGHSQTFTRTDAIRTALQRYVHSANFVVGKGYVTQSYEVVTNLEISVAGVAQGPTGPAYPDLFDQMKLDQPITVMTGDGIKTGTNESLIAVTSYGRRAITNESASVLTDSGYKNLVQKIKDGSLPPPSYSPNIDILRPGELTPTDLTINAQTATVTKTYYASSSENFIFAGKGHGHGTGISQYGALDLANAGVPAELIISTYLPGTELISIAQLKN